MIDEQTRPTTDTKTETRVDDKSETAPDPATNTAPRASDPRSGGALPAAAAAAAPETTDTDKRIRFAGRFVSIILVFVLGIGLAFYSGMLYQNHIDQPLFTHYSPPTTAGGSGGSFRQSGGRPTDATVRASSSRAEVAGTVHAS